MARIIQYIHRPNLTELGMGNTHDRYLVGPEDKLKQIFPLGETINVVDVYSNKVYSLYSKYENNELRIKLMGEICDDYQMEPGDEVVFTRYESMDEVKTTLQIIECGRIFLNPGRREKGIIHDFEIVNIDKLSNFRKKSHYSCEYYFLGENHKVEIDFSETRRKRSDSPDVTDFYIIKYDGELLESKNNPTYYLTIRNDAVILKSLPKYEFNILLNEGENELKKKQNLFDNTPLQQIFYGAPGTGKSHKIKDDDNVKVADEKNLVFRTTFHPDSDYSTFVGCYKPSMKSSERVLSSEELTIKLKELKTTGTTYPCHKFAAKYWESLKDLSTDNIKQILNACGFTDNYTVEVGKGIAIGQEYLRNPEDGKIVYSFTPQAFTNAYVKAWSTEEDVYLIIEEINRGNCAQIFGDLFQLLDRKNRVSEYPVEADTDLQNYLCKALADTKRTDIPNDVKSGKKLMLPSNLYIWATMNTSDQSLFPIDSAFKRRWDWVYMPIADAKKNYVIEIDNDQYDWWSFLEAINAIIESTTHSEDKKLGYFFAKAKDGRISVETFVSKVIFYLWNDVFKDNETNHKAFKDSDGELLAFRKFFHYDGTVDTNMVIKFLQDLEVFPFEHSDDGTAMVSDTTPNTKRQRDKSRYRVNGTDNLNKAQMTREAFRLYIEAHPDADAQTIAQAWNGLGLKDHVRHLVETEAEYNARTKDSTDSNKRATEFELSNGEKIYLSTQFGIGNIGKFMDAVNNAGWNIRIENQA